MPALNRARKGVAIQMQASEELEIIEPELQFPQKISSPLLKPTPILGVEIPHETKGHKTSIGINPLICAANPIFTLIDKINESQECPNLTKLNESLTHEIHAFETAAFNHDYRAEMILLARFALCALVDEIILSAPWSNAGQWPYHALLKTFQNETSAHDKFFILLERISKDAALNIDLLELMLLCLQQGFEGKYRQQPRGHIELAEITHTLYQTIRAQRGELDKRLLIRRQNRKQPQKTTKEITAKGAPIWQTLLLSLLITGGLYLASDYLFNLSEQPLLNQAMELDNSLRQA